MTAEKKFELPREIQLLPKEQLRLRDELTVKLNKISLLIGAGLIVLCVVTMGLMLLRIQIVKQLSATAEDLSTTINQLVSYSEVEAGFRELETSMNLIKEIRSGTAVSSDILAMIEENIPKLISLGSVQFSDDLYLNGSTSSYASVSYFLSLLKKHESVADAYLTQIRRDSLLEPIIFNITVEFTQ